MTSKINIRKSASNKATAKKAPDFCCSSFAPRKVTDTSLDNAKIYAERLRAEVEKSTVKYNDIELNYTISVGIAEVSPLFKNYEAWIECADAALYQSKENGRNQVTLYVQK